MNQSHRFTLALFISLAFLQFPELYSQELLISTEENLVFNNTNWDCDFSGAQLSAIGYSDANCPQSELSWKVEIDFYDDNSIDLTYSSALPRIISGDPNPFHIKPTLGGESLIINVRDIPGRAIHKVLWTLSDSCGNSDLISSNAEAVDQKGPTPYCLNLGSVILGTNTIVNAIDYNQNSFDNCCLEEELSFTFSKVPPPPRCDDYYTGADWYDGSHWFFDSEHAEANPDCHDLLAGSYRDELELSDKVHKWDPALKSSTKRLKMEDVNPQGLIELPVYVWDTDNNYDSCTVFLRRIIICYDIDFNYEFDSTDPTAVSFYDLNSGVDVGRKWSFGDGAFSEELNPKHSYENPGTYEVCLDMPEANSTACQSLTIEESVSGAIDDLGESLRFYPNPATNNLFIELGSSDTEVLVTMCNTTGMVMKSVMINSKKNLVDISDLEGGLYFYSLHSKGAKIHEGSLVKH